MTDAPSRPFTYRELVRIPNFRALWFGQIVSLLGDWFNLIASASLLADLTGSGLAIGGLFAIRMLAPFLTSPVAGVLADRCDRRRVLIFSDLLRAVIVCGFLLVRDPGDVILLYVLTAAQLAVSGTFFTSRRAILPDVVPGRAVGAANALGSATWSVMLAVGAGAGGLVAGGWGIYPAFLIDAATFLLSAAFIFRVRPEGGREPGAEPASFVRQYLVGLRYLRQTPDIFFIALHKAALGLFITAGYEVVQVTLANDVFPLGEAGGLSLGLFYATSGVGSGLGPILARTLTQDRQRNLRAALILGYLVCCAGLWISATLHSLPVVLAGSLLRSLGGGIIWVFSTQLLLILVPGPVRGRVFSVEHAAFTLVGALAAAAAGDVLDWAPGIGVVLAGMGAIGLLPAALWTLWHLRGRFTEPALE